MKCLPMVPELIYVEARVQNDVFFLPCSPLPVPQAGRQFRSFRACGTPGHKGQAGGAEDISKAFQLLPRAFNINDK